MIGELLLISAVAAGGAYALDPQVRNDVNDAIATGIKAITSGSQSTSNQPQSVSTTAANIGAGWQTVLNDLTQLFNNQKQLQQQIAAAQAANANTPPAVNINYPSPTAAGSSNSGLQSILAYLLNQQLALQQQSGGTAQQTPAAPVMPATQPAGGAATAGSIFNAAGGLATYNSYSSQPNPAPANGGSAAAGSIFNSAGGLATYNSYSSQPKASSSKASSSGGSAFSFPPNYGGRSASSPVTNPINPIIPASGGNYSPAPIIPFGGAYDGGFYNPA